MAIALGTRPRGVIRVLRALVGVIEGMPIPMPSARLTAWALGVFAVGETVAADNLGLAGCVGLPVENRPPGFVDAREPPRDGPRTLEAPSPVFARTLADGVL